MQHSGSLFTPISVDSAEMQAPAMQLTAQHTQLSCVALEFLGFHLLLINLCIPNISATASRLCLLSSSIPQHCEWTEHAVHAQGASLSTDEEAEAAQQPSLALSFEECQAIRCNDWMACLV